MKPTKYKPGYKGMWVYYHTVLAIELALVIVFLAMIWNKLDNLLIIRQLGG